MRRQWAYLAGRLRAWGWLGVVLFLAVALITLAALSYVLKKTSPTQLTVGAGMVMLMYLSVGAFMVIASVVFTTRREE